MTASYLRICDTSFDPEAEHKAFREAVGGAGAIVAFTGLVRGEGKGLTLTLSHYPGFTESQISEIARQAQARWPLVGWRILHRVGAMTAEEPIVFVATASRHRRDAFEAADFLMDFLKSEAAFWKSEKVDGNERWIEPRAQDITDKNRWS
ncbi:molybdenum cofactor biosynthesis protein MoaE [Hellea balneolensis]|uniref:molybdenum cofactor biosynthesis protein MoaE n=1 Tax=Hellea balneolensis TaxID=287478 RepID=UPI0004061D19|nr:molybdenum cofactor biosynthesis protein MoaE [Hellea balneolensis]